MKFSDLAKPKSPTESLQEKELALELQIKQLQEQALALSKQLSDTKAERKKIEPFTVTVDSLSNNRILLLADKHDKLLELFRRTPGRYYDGLNRNYIPLEQWTTFVKGLAQLQVKLEYTNGVGEAIANELNKARAKIYLHENKKLILIEILRGEDWLARQLQGIKKSGNHYQINVGEAWQLGEKLLKESNIDWDEAVKSLIISTAEKREALDKIATLEDIELPDIAEELDKWPIKVRPFQRVGVKFGELVDYRFILGDQMGLGKTIQAIMCSMRLKKELGKCRTLVIPPAGLKVNWTREINRLTGQSPLVLYGESPSKFLISELLELKHEYTIINYDILSTKVKHSVPITTASGQTLQTQVQWIFPWIEILNALQFDLVVFDEAHYTKNVGSNRSLAARMLKAKRVIFMTGTPVMNRPSELWPMLTVIDPDRFPSYENFIWTYGDKYPTNVKMLRDSLKNILIRRRKKDVMKDLPPINRVYEWHELSAEGQELYKKAKQGLYIQLAAWNPAMPGSEQAITNLLTEIMRLKQICAMDKVEAIADSALELSDSDSEGTGKVLIFSQFVPVVNEITKRLGHEAIAYTGEYDKDERVRIYDKFLADKALKFFVATWQTAGEGLNLQCANNVVFADLFWTPANHQQCEGRAYGRLEDPHPINSYYLICADTIETWIQELLAAKLQVIEQTVEGLDVDRSASIANDLLKRLKRELSL